MSSSNMMTLPQIAEMIVRTSADQIAWPKESKCAKGCGACCRQLVTVSPGEATRIAGLVNGMQGEAGERIRQRFKTAEKILSDSGMTDKFAELDSEETTPERHYEIAREYFQLQLACPFLENESCSIHDQRPLICREYHVSSDPARCSDPFANEVAAIFVPRRLNEAQKLLDAHLMGSDVFSVPLSLALHWTYWYSDVLDLEFDPSKVRALWDEYKLMCETGSQS